MGSPEVNVATALHIPHAFYEERPIMAETCFLPVWRRVAVRWGLDWVGGFLSSSANPQSKNMRIRPSFFLNSR